MALSERGRSVLYRGLVTAIGDEEAVAEMMAYFPSRDVEEPVTKEFLRAEMADLRVEMADLRAELRGEMADLRAEARGEAAGLRTEMAERIHRSTLWTVGAVTGWSAVLLAAIALVR